MKGVRFWILKNSMVLGNFISNFIGVQIVDIISHQSLAPPTPEVMNLARLVDWLYLPWSFLTIIITTVIYERPIRRVLNGEFAKSQPATQDVTETARRRLLNEPFVLMAFDLSVWFLAAIVYPVVFYRNGVEFQIIARTFFQTSLLGIITTICAFFVLERILQKWMVPVLFPTGGLYTTPKTLRIRIRTRLTALLFACNLVPFFAFLIILSGTYRMDTEPTRMLELLRPTFLINSLVFITLGVFVTILVGKNLAQPFGEIIQVLKNVRSGRLDGKVRVTTNDEIGYTGDVINEMTEGLKERETLRHSLELAREIQQNLLPKTSLSVRGMDIAGRSIYCDQTGGDYFDYLEFDDPHRGKIGLVVGDVSGHGIPSALLMATARAFIRFRTFMPGSIAQALTDVNRQLVRDVGNSGQFMTLFYLVVDPIEKTLNWIRAGHDPAILYDTNKDSFEELRGKGIALGVDKNWQYEENQKTGLADGQTIVIGTDGIWEACNSKGEMFGKAPLYEIIRKNQQADAGKILDTIIEALERFRVGHALEDDVTLIVVKIKNELAL